MGGESILTPKQLGTHTRRVRDTGGNGYVEWNGES